MCKFSKEKIWSCKIGGTEGASLPMGADAPMRRAVSIAYAELTGQEPDYIFSGWDAKLTKEECKFLEIREAKRAEEEREFLEIREAKRAEEEVTRQSALLIKLAELTVETNELLQAMLRTTTSSDLSFINQVIEDYERVRKNRIDFEMAHPICSDCRGHLAEEDFS